MAGTALVWVPIAVGFFLTNRPVKGAVLVLLGVAVISVIDNVLRPLYARIGSLQMPVFLLFVSVFGGLAAFGTWGAIIGPLIIRLTMEALALTKEPSDHTHGDQSMKRKRACPTQSGGDHEVPGCTDPFSFDDELRRARRPALARRGN